MQNIEEFVDQLIKDKGFDEKDPEVLAQIKSDLMDRLENRINALVVSELEEDKLEAFNTVLDSGSEEEMVNFVKANVPDLDEKVAGELLAFRNMYLG